MLAFIKTNYRAGDAIEVNTVEGIFTGEIEYVNNKYLVLRQPNGQIVGISAESIHTFRAESPVAVKPESVPVTRPAEEEYYDAPSEYDNTTLPGLDFSGEEEEDTNHANEAHIDLESLGLNIAEPKVVGRIDLDRVDPRYNRRRYFREGELPETEKTEKTMREDPYRLKREPYVPAKGRITYYNREKRYGFIRDYASDNDLYFQQYQVVDSNLYDQLGRGTKVVYSLDRNQQGMTAVCLHLPNTVSRLLEIVERQIEARRYQYARGICEHIIESDPENVEAKALLEELQNYLPTPRFTPTTDNPTSSQYNPYTIYSGAKKAYLEKDYAEAEKLYLRAIEAEEKTESCVKDLLTLYVSLFKIAETEEERKEVKEKADNLLESYRYLLPDNLTNNQFLALNYYLPTLDYDHFMEIVDKIMKDPSINENVSRKIFYIWQKAIVLIKTNHTEEALALAEEGLLIAPHSRQLQNVRNGILHPEMYNREQLGGHTENNPDEEEKTES